MNRVSPEELVDQALRGWGFDGSTGWTRPLDAPAGRGAGAGVRGAVDAEVRRRAAEVRGPQHVARHTVRPAIEQVDFTSARKADLELMRREIQPLARRLATRLSREHTPARGAARLPAYRPGLDVQRRRPLETRHRPKRPARTDLVVLCDVSGSVANFASFTLMLVFALREQFNRVRAFTFVDEIHEVTDRFDAGGDPAQTMADLAASARHAIAVGPHQLRPRVHPVRRAAPRRAHPQDQPARARRRPLQPHRPRAARWSRTWCTPPGTAGGSTPSTPQLEHRRLRGPRVRPAGPDGRVPQPDPAREFVHDLA